MAVKETTIEIKLQNLKSNFKFLKSKINTDTKFMAVVKAFSYGSDSLTISEELEKNGVDARVLGLNEVQVQHPKRVRAFEQMIKSRSHSGPNQGTFFRPST